MTIRLSTFVRNEMLGTNGFSSIFENGVIEIRSGSQPSTADSAATGTLLGIVTVNGGVFTPDSPTNGLTFSTPSGGVINKAENENWQWTGLVRGIAGWFRLKGNAPDDGSADSEFEYARMDGSIGSSGADMLMANLTVEVGAPDAITQFRYTLPAS